MEKFERGYFINSSTSNYVDYRLKQYTKLAEDLLLVLDLDKKDRILDFGCATGTLVKIFKEKGFSNVVGTDISFWAVDYGKTVLGLGDVLEHYNRNLLCEPQDCIILLDVLEHMTNFELENVVSLAKKGLRNQLVLRVPTSRLEGEDYFLPLSRNDKTHIQIHDRCWWIQLFEYHGFEFVSDINSPPSIHTSTGVFAGIFK